MSARRAGSLAAMLAVALGLGPAPARAQDASPETVRPLIAPARAQAGDEPSELPLPDDQKIARARNLVRMGYAAQAQELVDDVALRHPDDLDVLLARAELMSRTRSGDVLVRFFDEEGARPEVRRQLAARPRRAGFWHRYRAEALFAAGRTGDAARAALAAWETGPEQSAWAHVRLADAASADPKAVQGLGRELRQAADRHPERTDLAIAAAQDEARAGQVRAAIRRLERADGQGDDPRRGGVLWQFGLSMLERGEGESALADSAFAAIALDPSADPTLRQQATDRLFNPRTGPPPVDMERLQGAVEGRLGALPLGGPDAFMPPGGTRVPGTKTSRLVRLRVDGQGRLVVDSSPPGESSGPGGASAAGGGTAATPVRPGAPGAAVAPATPGAATSLSGLERIWRDLPPSSETVRRGLDLADRMRAAGDPAGATRLEDAAAHMSQGLAQSGQASDPDLDGRLALREGDAALTAGDLARAAQAFARAAGSNASDRVREEAQFESCETAFFAGQFDSAAAGYDRFARAHPSGPFTNDALDRVYLIESGDGGAVPGLAELAKALRLARTRAGEDALAAGLVAEKASAGGPAWAHVELLLADLLAASGRTADAVAKAVAVAETKPDDRLAPAARKKAGDLYHAMGQDALALEQYDALLLRYPRSWLAPEARRAANELRAKSGGNP